MLSTVVLDFERLFSGVLSSQFVVFCFLLPNLNHGNKKLNIKIIPSKDIQVAIM